MFRPARHSCESTSLPDRTSPFSIVKSIVIPNDIYYLIGGPSSWAHFLELRALTCLFYNRPPNELRERATQIFTLKVTITNTYVPFFTGVSSGDMATRSVRERARRLLYKQDQYTASCLYSHNNLRPLDGKLMKLWHSAYDLSNFQLTSSIVLLLASEVVMTRTHYFKLNYYI